MRIALVLPLLFLGCQTSPVPPVGVIAPPKPERSPGEIKRYIERLGSKNAAVCLDAVEYLPYFGEDAIPFLVQALENENPNRRALAAATLARLPHRDPIPILIPMLDDSAALRLNVLSDDGESIHPAYPNGLPKFVAQQAKATLRTITGKSFPTRAKAEAWWKENRGTFRVGANPVPPLPVPAHARHLRGIRICIDPGHGGDTHKRGFKRGVTYLSEAEVNLRVARFLRDLLVAAGARVTLTRHGDRELSLKARADMSANHDLFLSIHHNWARNLRAKNTSTWYHLTPDHKPAAMDLARFLQRNVFREIGLEEWPSGGGLMSDGLMYKSGFGILRNLPPNVPGVVCEMTYYSNLEMERKLRDIDFNRREARGLFLGLAEYLYYGVPRAELIANTAGELRFRVYDGLEGRKAWTKKYKIFRDHIVVRLDGTRVPHTYDDPTGTILVKHALPPGEHRAEVTLINIHKNHNLPKSIPFSIPEP